MPSPSITERKTVASIPAGPELELRVFVDPGAPHMMSIEGVSTYYQEPAHLYPHLATLADAFAFSWGMALDDPGSNVVATDRKYKQVHGTRRGWMEMYGKTLVHNKEEGTND